MAAWPEQPLFCNQAASRAAASRLTSPGLASRRGLELSMSRINGTRRAADAALAMCVQRLAQSPEHRPYNENIATLSQETCAIPHAEVDKCP